MLLDLRFACVRFVCVWDLLFGLVKAKWLSWFYFEIRLVAVWF